MTTGTSDELAAADSVHEMRISSLRRDSTPAAGDHHTEAQMRMLER